MGMLDAEAILALYQDRKRYYGPVHQKMQEIRAIYDGEIRTQLSDLNRSEDTKTPNLLASGVDQMAARIASVSPMVTFSSENPGVRMYDRRATTARQVIMAWWQADRLSLKRKDRARHLIAYGMAPAVVTYDRKLKRPTWTVRSPLETYPSPLATSGEFTPTDVIFAYERTAAWMVANGYGAAIRSLQNRNEPRLDSRVLLLEYVCPQGTVLVAAGVTQPADTGNYQIRPVGDVKAVVIEAVPNPTGVMTASVPTRITLNRMGGQFDSMVGMYYTQEKLMALEIMAVEKDIFPDTWLVGNQGATPQILDGPHDGRSGLVNVVKDGQVTQLRNQPGYMTTQTMDRLERAQRLTGGLPQDFGGESGTNIRTGRRGDAVLSAVIDFPISEAQEVMAYGLMDEDKAAIALAKYYDGDAVRQIYVGTGNQSLSVKYNSKTVFSHSDHVVNYPASGTDLNSLMIGLGQRVGLGTMSKETAAFLDPFVDSPEMEHDRIIAEGLEQALVSGIQQQAASGQIPPLVLSKVMALVKNDKMELADALVKVTEDAQKTQAAQQAAPPDPGTPQTADQAMAPAAGALAGQVPPAIPGANPSQAGLANLLTQLRKPQRTIMPNAGVAQGAV